MRGRLNLKMLLFLFVFGIVVGSFTFNKIVHISTRGIGSLLNPTPSTDPQVPAWVTDPAARIRVAQRIKEQQTLEAQGARFLATALIEIHRALYRYEPWHDDDTARVESLKMMFEVWAKMPAPKDSCPGRDAQGHQVCP